MQTQLEQGLGYHFSNVDLLLTALTHPSFRNEHPEVQHDNQRLEFLGDAVLDLLLAEQLYQQAPDVDEGALTVLRSQCASGRALAEIARSVKLGECLRFGRGADNQHNRNLESNLAAALESVLGAAWLDGGLQGVRAIYAMLFHERTASLKLNPWSNNPKGELQALVQSRGRDVPQYSLLSSSGPEHAPRHRVEVEADNRKATGEGNTKQAAEKAAARAWLDLYLP